MGVALLDPSTESLKTSLAGESGSGVPSVAAGRPKQFTQSDVLKVLVLMTDGENTQQWDLYDHYKDNLPFVWANQNNANDLVSGWNLAKTTIQTTGSSGAIITTATTIPTNSIMPTTYSLTIPNGTEADARLSDICAAARTQGVVIYTVAFKAPSAGRSALRDCASSPSHYFDVNGTDISSAFSAIASDIRALKLKQ